MLSGHHFFLNPTTLVYDMNVNPRYDLGIVIGKKITSSTAPKFDGVGAGNIPWL
jgi:hypothetical protein